MTDTVLALNVGSSSLKFGLFDRAGTSASVRGKIDGIGKAPRFTATDSSARTIEDRDWNTERASHGAVLGELLDWIEQRLGGEKLVGVGHRIVHGGREFSAPVRLTPEVVDRLDALTPLAPLHQPGSLAPVRVIAQMRPELVQVGCFDTAFHHGLEPPVSRYAIPRALEEEGVRRYGFHGLSYEFVAGRLGEIAPGLAAGRTVVAHLGNGASLCAMRGGVSVDTTMGFSALDGLVMGTRPGALDPGVLLHLLRKPGFTPQRLEEFLYRDCGLLGVSGISSDMRTLEASEDPRAEEAIDLFAFRLSRETAAMANTLGGLDGLVFTGGIGEHSAGTRAKACRRLAWLGVELDEAANAAGAEVISSPASRVVVRIVPTDEEAVIARHTARLLGAPNDEA
jgi:acetate kinase